MPESWHEADDELQRSTDRLEDVAEGAAGWGRRGPVPVSAVAVGRCLWPVAVGVVAEWAFCVWPAGLEPAAVSCLAVHVLLPLYRRGP